MFPRVRSAIHALTSAAVSSARSKSTGLTRAANLLHGEIDIFRHKGQSPVVPHTSANNEWRRLAARDNTSQRLAELRHSVDVGGDAKRHGTTCLSASPSRSAASSASAEAMLCGETA